MPSSRRSRNPRQRRRPDPQSLVGPKVDPVAEAARFRPDTGKTTSGFRPDIEGLRGVAVLLVVLFHIGLAGFGGGFVGVDVFFVISGFLITGLLVREQAQTGSIGLAAFYARRLRRLLPAGAVVLVVSLAVAMVVVAPLDRPGVAQDAVAVALSVGNIRFAAVAGDYFAALGGPSPFLQFWTLGVEEQFYLIWPLLVLLVGRGARPRLVIGITLATIALASFMASLALTDLAAPWAFYSLPTRAWQLAAGGLLALAWPGLALVKAPILAVVGWAGLAGLALSCNILGPDLAYLGLVAVLPTSAAVALLVGGGARSGPGILLVSAPLRFVGKISYSLYLWHWPILVLPAVALGSGLPFVARIGLALAAVAIAALSWRFVEEPFRRRAAGQGLPARRTIMIGATIIAALALGAGGLSWATAVSPSVATASPVPAATDGGVFSAWPSPAPSSGPGASARPWPSLPPLGPEATVIALPADVSPSLAGARLDEGSLRADGCLAGELAIVPFDCVYGDKAASFTVALVGDSHVAQWLPALELVAAQRHWRIIPFVKVSCAFIDMPMRNKVLRREYRECATWNDAVVRKLGDIKPGLVIVGMSRLAINPLNDQDASDQAKGDAIGRMVKRLTGPVMLITDTPGALADIPACISANQADVRRCAIPRATALRADLGAIERIAANATGAGVIDLTSRVCRADPCPVVVGKFIIFRDDAHLTATFARSLAPDLDRLIGLWLGG